MTTASFSRPVMSESQPRSADLAAGLDAAPERQHGDERADADDLLGDPGLQQGVDLVVDAAAAPLPSEIRGSKTGPRFPMPFAISLMPISRCLSRSATHKGTRNLNARPAP